MLGAAQRLGGATRLGEKELAMSGVRSSGGQFRDMFLDEAGIEAVRGEIGMPQQALEKPDVGRDALDPELAERAVGPRHRRGKVRRGRVRDQLGQQRIEVRVGRVAGIGERIHAQAGPRRRFERGQRPAGGFRRAVLAHRLHVDAHLDRKAARLRNVRLEHSKLGERAPVRELQLELDEIDAGHFLGHRMLDLKAGVGLDEGELRVAVACIGVEQKLERAEAVVVDRLRHPHGRCGEPVAQTLGQAGAGRNLEQLLIAPLDGAFALPHMADATRPVAGDLNFEVARARHQPLDIYVGVAKGGSRFRLASPVCLVYLFEAIYRAHPAAAAAGDRLDHHRAALSERGQKFSGFAHAGGDCGAGQQWHSETLGEGPGAHLVAKELEDVRSRADELDLRFGHAASKAGVLAQESVAGMDGVASGGLRDRHDLFDVQIGGRADAGERAGFIGLAGMKRAGVVFGKDRHGADAQLGGGARDADGYFASVGDQKTAEKH